MKEEFAIIIEKNMPLLDEILEPWRDKIGEDFVGYKNHVYRMANFCFILKKCSEEEKVKIIIAACFHDIGIWVENTLDYIPPSIPPAMKYLEKINRDEWATEIELMIREHHKIRPFDDPRYPIVELFRKGDLVDFSIGLFRFGIPNDLIKSVKAAFPNAGFHMRLVRLAASWLVKHPLNPAPVFKW